MVSVMRLTDRLHTRWLEATHYLESFVVRARLGSSTDVLQAQILHDLQTEGVHVTSIDQLLPDSAPALRHALKRARELLHEPALQQPSRLL